TQAVLPKKVASAQESQDSAPTTIRNQHQLHDAFLDVAHIGTLIALRENRLAGVVVHGFRYRQPGWKQNMGFVRPFLGCHFFLQCGTRRGLIVRAPHSECDSESSSVILCTLSV